jgi:hypothetical protein
MAQENQAFLPECLAVSLSLKGCIAPLLRGIKPRGGFLKSIRELRFCRPMEEAGCLGAVQSTSAQITGTDACSLKRQTQLHGLAYRFIDIRNEQLLAAADIHYLPGFTGQG